MFAIVETGGTQFKVEKGTILDVNRVEGSEGDTYKITTVLLINDSDVKVGAPVVNGAYVEAKIVKHKRGEKIVVFKMKAKKRYQKKQGHRQDLTTIEIVNIHTGSEKAKPAAKKEEKEEVTA
jgi:large subunit ribosomal protein L21